MSLNIEQGKVIENLNAYLTWHNMPVRMNEEGICNGLASVYVKYALEDREQEFLDLLTYIVNKAPTSDMEAKINQFVYEVVLTLFTDQFEKKLSQANSIKVLSIKNVPLKSSFDFALTTSDSNWEELVKTLDLQDDEVMRVLSATHTVAVRKIRNKYRVYDPNYSSGIKEFANEKELISELHYNVFGYHNGYFLNGGPLGLMVNVIRHPQSKRVRVFPKINDLYDKYLTHDNVNDAALTFFNNKFITLEKAAILNDASVIRKLLEIGAKDRDNQAVANAVIHNNPDALSALLLNNKDTILYQQLFIAALENGREEVYDRLLKLKGALPLYSNTAVRSAAAGGNPQLLSKVLRYFIDNHSGLSDLSEAVLPAIQGGSVGCVKLLIEHMTKYKKLLSFEKKMEYVLEAIRCNHFSMVRYLIQDLPLGYCRMISMNTTAVDRTDLSVLHLLQKRGVIFSKPALAVIAQKEHREVGISLIIGIILHKFTDFFAEIIFKNSGVYFNPKTNSMKERFFETKDTLIKDSEFKSEPVFVI